MSTLTVLFAQGRPSTEPGGLEVVLCLTFIALLIAYWAGCWAVYEKAGMRGWASLIPVYKHVVMMRIVDRPAWWTVLLIFSCTTFFAWYVVCMDLANSFGKGTRFGLGLFFQPFVFFPILGFSDAHYIGRTMN